MINLQQQLRLGLKLTPQQVQYLKLLQLPTLSLEQRIKLELELNPMLELFYWKDIHHREVVLKDGLEVKQLIQVCWNVEDFKTKERELRSLKKAMA